MSIVPPDYFDLLERPLIGHLATTSPNGRPQVNPMWYLWEYGFLRFSHTNTRRKFAQLQVNPHVALSIVDPDNGYRYLEVRGRVESIDPDPTGAFYALLSARYGKEGAAKPDAPTRVILNVRPLHATYRQDRRGNS